MHFGQTTTAYRAYFNRNRVLYVLHADPSEGETIAQAFSEQGFMASMSSSLAGLARLAQLHSPDIVLIDLDLLMNETQDIIGDLKSMAFGVRVFALTDDHPQAAHIVKAVRSGTLSVFVRPYQIADMIRTVVDELRSDIRAPGETYGRSMVGGPASLTQRELEVFRRVADGETNKEIGLILGISPRTVEVHRLSAMRKLGAKNTAQLVRIAMAG
jgi:two-component system, LuxR family, response regulator FixJ